MKFYRDVVTFHYENGMRLHVLPQPGTAVEVECFIRTGSIHEGRHLGCGLSHFLEHMMFQGCRDYPGTAVSDTIDRLGGTMNAYTSYDHTAYHATVAAKHLGTAVKVLGSMVRYPEFPEARFRAEREVILRERELGVDNPSRRLFEALNQELFKIHPMRHPIIGYRELIAGVSKEMMETYYRERYTPGRCFWVIVGDVVPGQAYEEIGALLGDWPAAHLAEALLPEEPVQCAPRSSSFRFADPLARLGTAGRIPEASHPDIPALDVLAGIFGMGDGSRLVRVLELEQKLAIDLRSFCYTQPCGGLLGIGCTAAPGKLNKLQSALKRELEKIRKGDLTKAEVEREKTQQTADHLRQLRGLREIAADIAGGVIANDAPALSDLYMEKLAKLDVDDIRRVAATYLDENSFATVTQLTGKESARIHSAPAPKPPRPETSRLGNGARVLTLTDRRLPMIDLALLRAPKYPDWDADRGDHTFTYSFLPHANGAVDSEVRAEALRLNRPPQRFDGLAGSAELPVRVEAEQVELAALKKAEKEDCAVVRLVERGGRHSSAVLHTACRLVETGLTEWEDGAELTPVDGRIVVTFRPFEIKTFKLKK